jgi:PAS domain S-box-containing protein
MTEYTFGQLIDVDQVRRLLESHHQLSGMAYGLLDNSENNMVSVGWQEICTRFHRVHPVCSERCRESNAFIKAHLHDVGDGFLEYRCDNGMIDVAMPIVIEGRHLATFFAGHFFYDDAPPDRSFFLAQAREFGFDPDDYLAALDRAPVFSREYIRANLKILHAMVRMLTESGLKSFMLNCEMKKRMKIEADLLQTRTERLRFAEERIAAQEQEFCSLAENSPEHIIRYDRECRAVYANSQVLKALSLPLEQVLGKTPVERCSEGMREEQFAEYVDYEGAIRRTLHTGVAGEAMLHLALPSGEVCSHKILITPERDEGGAIIGALVFGRDVTGREAAERQLRELHKRLEAIFLTIPDLVWLKDVNGTYLACNPAFERFFGAKEDEIVGKTDFDFVDAELAQFFRNNDAEAIRAGGVRINEEWITFADTGENVFLETRKAPVYDHDNRVIGVLGIGRDITGRKEAERNIATLNFALNNVHESAYLIDESARFHYVNESAGRELGYSCSELCELGVPDIDPDFSMERWPNHWEEIKASGSLTFESRNRAKDGRIIPVEINANYVEYDGEGYNFALVRDITERKLAEMKLRETNERFRSVLRAATAYSIIGMDTDGVVKVFNEGAERILGYCAEEVIDRTTPELFHDRGEIASRAAEIRINPGFEVLVVAARKGETETREWTYVRKDGSRITVSLTVTAMLSESGALAGFIGIARDVTMEKKLEQQLQQSQKMDAIGQLAGGIAHDFNNIMTAIVGFSHVLGMKLGSDSPLNSYLDKILASADRATALTRDLLTFSRKQVMQLKPIALGKALAGAQHLISRLLREDIELIVSSPDAEFTVMAAENHVTQILMNLTINARDAMPSGGQIIISISAVTMDREYVTRHGFGKVGRFALITFADTGCGMDEKTRERIFEPFFTTKEVGKGTGLGLSTVYGIVRQLGGFISVYSEPGKGTTFRIHLPLFGSTGEIDETPTDLVLYPAGTETVLLAEDDPDVREIVKSLLSEAGYKVISAGSGSEALRIFSDLIDTIDLLILDAVMPGKNGIDVFMQARNESPEVKAIMMSGYTSEVMVVNGLIERGLRFLQKPVNPSEFLRAVRETLDR